MDWKWCAVWFAGGGLPSSCGGSITVVVWYGATAVPFGGPVGAAAPKAGAAEANGLGTESAREAREKLVHSEPCEFTGAKEATPCSRLLRLLSRLAEAAKGRRSRFGCAKEATGGSGRGSGRLTKSRGSSACELAHRQCSY